MSGPHTTRWARAFAQALTATADAATVDDAKGLLTTAAPALNVNQGFATAKFPLPNGRVARPRLLVEQLTSQQWARLEDAICAHPDATRLAGGSAVSDELADPARTAGIPLLPAPHDISHTCTCTPSRTTACPHSLAVGLLLAARLRTAAAPLFTLRGRAHHHLKKRLRAGSMGTPLPRQSPPPHTEPPAPAHHEITPAPRPVPAQLPPIPQPADLDLTAPHPVLAGPLPEPPAPLLPLPVLGALADDAAHRAQALLDHDNDVPPLCPGTGSDVARFLSLPHGAPFREQAMAHLGLGTVGLGHLTLAHIHGGPAGAATYLEPSTVDHDVLARAQADIQPLRPAPTATVECEDNRLTDSAAGVQLRYGPDGRWYPYLAPYGTWQPVPGPSADPALAYRAARRAIRAKRHGR
ncbi:hypothetical protein [Streptomyces spectabilis]|uniref:SWIM-type domain-containing protein n=1 Tax=Streptomyces spectabilis TaxID=68270 RepID=A0A7W8B275_STRST|nr:hypothetical protein [Streptomyces spectabilis]MBB5109014.1 hypothetical protein [Streptomyces spectabilis]GGV50665.1 hypothetical protein GCM10010245_79860 [Streptomyces spectabilis]